jgi:hypothetical protein
LEKMCAEAAVRNDRCETEQKFQSPPQTVVAVPQGERTDVEVEGLGPLPTLVDEAPDSPAGSAGRDDESKAVKTRTTSTLTVTARCSKNRSFFIRPGPFRVSTQVGGPEADAVVGTDFPGGGNEVGDLDERELAEELPSPSRQPWRS